MNFLSCGARTPIVPSLVSDPTPKGQIRGERFIRVWRLQRFISRWMLFACIRLNFCTDHLSLGQGCIVVAIAIHLNKKPQGLFPQHRENRLIALEYLVFVYEQP